jgi:hypothetical protein
MCIQSTYVCAEASAFLYSLGVGSSVGVGVGFFVGFGVAVGLGVAVGFDVGTLVGCVSDTLPVAVTVGGLVACTVAVVSLVLFRGRITNRHTATIRQVNRTFQTGFSLSALQMAMMPIIGAKKIQSSTLPNVIFFFGSSGDIVQRSPCMSMPAGVPQFEQKLPVNSVPHLPHRWTKVLPPQAVQKAFPSLFSVPQFLQIFMLFLLIFMPIVMILFLAVVAQVPDKNPDQPQSIRSTDQSQIHQCAKAALPSCHAITSSAGIHIGNMIFTRERTPSRDYS